MKNFFVIYSYSGNPLRTHSFCTCAKDKAGAISAFKLNMPNYRVLYVHKVVSHNGTAKLLRIV